MLCGARDKELALVAAVFCLRNTTDKLHKIEDIVKTDKDGQCD
jgi:hypothetical protein